MFRLPVTANVPVAGLYSSALARGLPLEPPVISTISLLSSVAVCEERAVFRLPVETNPAVTVNVAEPLTEPNWAWIVACPGPCAIARPPAVIVATPVNDELHATLVVKFCVLLSL